MLAAIYARKSADQNLPDAEKSVTRQVAHHRHTDHRAVNRQPQVGEQPAISVTRPCRTVDRPPDDQPDGAVRLIR